MKSARKFIQPMEYTGLPGQANWAGYEYLQWTGNCIHPGLDYNWSWGEQDKGKPVLTIASGLVEKCLFWDGNTKGFGNHIFVKHILDFDYELDGILFKRGDILYSHYCHLDSIIVKDEQDISVGQKIGTCGGSGGWPSHLHIELRKALGKGYNFWPSGYSAEWIAQRYFDIYQFIEDNKGGIMTDCLLYNNSKDQDTFKKLVEKSSYYDEFKKEGFDHASQAVQLIQDMRESVRKEKELKEIEKERGDELRGELNDFISALADDNHLHTVQEKSEILAQAAKTGKALKEAEDLQVAFATYKTEAGKSESDLNAEIKILEALLKQENVLKKIKSSDLIKEILKRLIDIKSKIEALRKKLK